MKLRINKKQLELIIEKYKEYKEKEISLIQIEKGVLVEEEIKPTSENRGKYGWKGELILEGGEIILIESINTNKEDFINKAEIEYKKRLPTKKLELSKGELQLLIDEIKDESIKSKLRNYTDE